MRVDRLAQLQRDRGAEKRRRKPGRRHQVEALAAGTTLALGMLLAAPAMAQVVFPPPAPANTFQTAIIDDTKSDPPSTAFPSGKPRHQTFPCDPEAVTRFGACTSPPDTATPNPNGSGPPAVAGIGASMTAVISNITVNGSPTPTFPAAGSGIIKGDTLEFDVTITNTSTNGALLTAFGFQSKNSESPALASRIGDKLFLAILQSGGVDGQLSTVKKNGTSNGLLPGKWKGICITSGRDFIPEFNSGVEDEPLECAGAREDRTTQDANGVAIPGSGPDGNPELNLGLGLPPGGTQTIRIRLDSGTTDGAAHRVPAGTLTGTVQGTLITTGPNGIDYIVPSIVAGSGNVLEIPDFGDNKVLRNAAGAFDPFFAPAPGFSLSENRALTFPRVNRAFSDLLGRNHTCENYGLTLGSCAGGGSPLIHLLATGDLVAGVQNFAAILHGFGEYIADATGKPIGVPGVDETRPSQPYGLLCENCGGAPNVPIAEFYVPNSDGQTATRQIQSGNYGPLGSSTQYTATSGDSNSPAPTPGIAVKQEVICIATNREFEFPQDGSSYDCKNGSVSSGPRVGTPFGGKAVAHFHDLQVSLGGGLNGGDAIQFSVTIHNTSTEPGVFLTSFNYQTKRRGLADINILDGTSQNRRDIRLDTTLPVCSSLDDEACINFGLTNGNGTTGVGQFPNVIGNGLLFGQMVWTDADAGREPTPVDTDQVFVDTTTGINPVPYQLESVKKNGPFAPILKGNVNFICIKTGLFLLDPDADAACAGDPAVLADPLIDPIPSNIVTTEGPFGGRLGIPPGGSQTVRMRQDFGDFRGVLLRIVPGTLTGTETTTGSPETRTGLFRNFDCQDQRELEFCHPDVVGQNIGYIPGTSATWQTPASLADVEFVILNQPGTAARVMNFADNFGFILRMAGFRPSAEFYKPDNNTELAGLTIGGQPVQGVLIREQVLGEYTIDQPASAPLIVSSAVTTGAVGQAYTYDVNATGFPAARYSLTTSPTGMAINETTGLISWTPTSGGVFNVAVKASNGTNPDATQSFQVTVPGSSGTVLDDFNRRDSLLLSGNWSFSIIGYRVASNRLDVGLGGPVLWRNSYGSNQEASIELVKIDRTGGRHALLLKSVLLDGIRVSYLPRTNEVLIESRSSLFRPWTSLGSVKLPTALADGSRLSARAGSDGSVTVEVNGTTVATANAGTAFRTRGGHIGLWFENANQALADNFGGGNFSGTQISLN
jgi:hypothetical protein